MKDWDNIVGNEQLKEYFLNAVSTGNLAHSYLITGEDGMGKMTIAKCFARTILCESKRYVLVECVIPANRWKVEIIQMLFL